MASGFHAIQAALEANKTIEKVFIAKGLRGDLYQTTLQSIQQHQVPIQWVPMEKLDRMRAGNHQGMVAFISPIEFHELEPLVVDLFSKGITPLLILLDGITDVRNMGAIARSAECMGAHALILPEHGSAPVNEDALHTSAGALMHIPVCRVGHAADAVALLQAMNVECIAATEKASLAVQQTDLTGPVCWVMGNEEKGISNQVLKLIKHHVRITMTGQTTSLNVSVATGMLLFETTRQRLSK